MSRAPSKEETSSRKEYPLVRYMGSKYKLLDWIENTLKPYEYESVLDGFSGSGAVSYLFKSMGKQVYSNDFLYMSYTLARATTENASEILTPDDLELLYREADGADNFIEKTFKDIFFSREELIFLDRISHNITLLDNEYKQCLAKSALIRSCLKKQPRGVFTISGNLDKHNDGRRDLRLSLSEHFREQAEIYNGIIFDNGKENRAFHGDIYGLDEKALAPDLVYLDPPYVPRSDDNCYVKRYHFVEGLSKYWEGETIRYDTKVRKIEKKYTPFSYRRTAVEAFDRMFEKFSRSIIALSYSSNGYPGLEELVGIMGRYKKNVEIRERDHRYHFGTHKAVSRAKVKEYLIIGS